MKGEATGILQRLADGAEGHPGKNRVIKLLDFFELKGPNGHHECLITPKVTAQAI